MENNNTVQLKICESGLIKNLGAIFTNKTKVLTELTQNARRAGSDFVNFNFDEETSTLTVQDGGCGIDNLQNLLSVALSGWTEEVGSSESAYGMGFLATLFSCEKIQVLSKGKKFLATTESILNMQPCVITDTEEQHHQGTEITLYNFKMNGEEISKAMDEIATGYSINIRYNGACLARPNCEEHLLKGHDTHVFEYGTLYFNQTTFKSSFNCYLQGVHILSDHSRNLDQRNVYAHLNSAVKARMPDRDHLLDEQVIKIAIQSAINQYFIAKLRTLQSELNDKDFVEAFGDVVLELCPMLLNESEYLPTKLFKTVGEYPIVGRQFDDNCLADITDVVSKDMIVNKEVILIDVEKPSCGDESFAPIMYVFLKELTIISDYEMLDKDHWVYSHITVLEDDVVLEPFGESKTISFRGQWVYTSVTFVESYNLIGPLGLVSCDNYGIGLGEEGLYIPQKETTGLPIEQMSSFESEYNDFNEEARDHDEQLLTSMILHSRCDTKAELLTLALNVLTSDVVNELKGTGFTLVFDESGTIKVTEAT